MIFCGSAFFAGLHSLDPTLVPISGISVSSIKLSSGVFDYLFGTQDTSLDMTTPLEWTFNTVLWAKFQGNLSAGNIDYTLDQITSVLIKRRELYSFDWVTLFEIPISSVYDFSFEKYDRLNRAGVTYEYALVPLLNDIQGDMEGNYNVNSVESQFTGLYIVEMDRSFGTILESGVPQRQRNISNALVETIDSKFPFVINQGESNYDTLQISGIFIEQTPDHMDFKVKEGYAYRNDLMNFLANKKSKVIKMSDGRIWLVSIINKPSETQVNWTDNFTTSFEAAEIGNPNNTLDLYNNGEISTNSGLVVR